MSRQTAQAIEPIAAPEAERSALGAALLDPTAAAVVLPLLGDEDPYAEGHRRILRAIRSLVAHGEQPDATTVSGELRREGVLERVGGTAYLTELAMACPTSAMAGTYAHAVVEAARRRRVEQLGLLVSAAARDHGTDLTETLTDLQQRLAAEVEGPPAGRPQVVMVAPRASEIEPLPIDWLWEGWLPRGMLATVAGEPKAGKSVMLRAIAAAVSCGAPLPGNPRPREPEVVLLVPLEDDPARVVVPSLKIMGAEMDNVFIYEEMKTSDGHPAPIVLPDHVPAMADFAAHIHPALIVIDPLVAAESLAMDTHKQKEMRAVLDPLRRLAADTGAGVVVVRHTRKSEAAEVMHRIMGSIDVVACARTVLVVGRDPERPERRAVAVAGTNLGVTPDPRSYAVDPSGVLLWHSAAASDLTPDRLLGAPSTAEERDALREAEELIRGLLATGPIPTADLERAAKANGISERTLNRARHKLKVKATKPDGVWTASLPPEGCQEPPRKDVGTLGTLDETRTATGQNGRVPRVPSPSPGTHGTLDATEGGGDEV